ncbi:hypothetical protein NDU88_005102 [Pleurodeles waltl]|uniref:Uncharacterized protein n=1 Tax=Pleurodeles waltl TaxID=8319 RepID=A0AAV7TAN7_PLEWA|nr:hypothetical protein NDU88_005102 [Pleurodeles waltl]
MAYYANDDEQYGELQEIPSEHEMEERLVEALGYHVQDSVNWALIQALKPFTQPLSNFAKREFLGESSQQPRLQSGDPGEAVLTAKWRLAQQQYDNACVAFSASTLNRTQVRIRLRIFSIVRLIPVLGSGHSGVRRPSGLPFVFQAGSRGGPAPVRGLVAVRALRRREREEQGHRGGPLFETGFHTATRGRAVNRVPLPSDGAKVNSGAR